MKAASPRWIREKCPERELKGGNGARHSIRASTGKFLSGGRAVLGSGSNRGRSFAEFGTEIIGKMPEIAKPACIGDRRYRLLRLIEQKPRALQAHLSQKSHRGAAARLLEGMKEAAGARAVMPARPSMVSG